MKPKRFYFSFILLPILGIGFDLVKQAMRGSTSQTFNLIPALAFEIFANILFAGLILWMTFNLSKYPLPKPWPLILMVAGLLMVCLPILSYTGILAFRSLQFTLVYWVYAGIAGSYLLLVGVEGVFSKRRNS